MTLWSGQRPGLTVSRRAGYLSSRIVAVFASAVTVTSTRAPFSSLTSSPFSSVNVFSIRRFRDRRSAPSREICAFSGWLGRGDGMILSTIPDKMVLGCSRIRVVSRFSSAILADLAMRGFAISFVTLARVMSSGCFVTFLMRHAPIMTARGRTYSPISDTSEICGLILQKVNRGVCLRVRLPVY